MITPKELIDACEEQERLMDRGEIRAYKAIIFGAHNLGRK